MNQVATFTVEVKPAQAQPLTLTPNGGALPAETVGTAASDEVCSVSGGTAPYGFAVTGGAVPDGMQLMEGDPAADGSVPITLDGTPTKAGSFSFDLTVTDSSPATQTAQVSVRKAISSAKPAKR